MVPGNPYPELVEFRRRVRYAVLAALSRAGFVPEDAERIGYFEPRDQRMARTGPYGSPPPKRHLQYVPYEWMTAEPRRRAVRDSSRFPSPVASPGAASRVLVLWIDEDAIFSEPFTHLGLLVNEVLVRACGASNGSADERHGKPAASRLSILGPLSTGTLEIMAEQVQRARGLPAPPPEAGSIEASAGARMTTIGSNAGRPALRADSPPAAANHPSALVLPEFSPPWTPVFYVYGATTDDSAILESALGGLTIDPAALSGSLEAFFRHPKRSSASTDDSRKPGFDVVRTIGTDGALARSLAQELRRRRAAPSEPQSTCAGSGRTLGNETRHVVLIAERDSSYGRTLAGTMADTLAEGQACPERWLHTLSYLRGLDGQLPTASAPRSDVGTEGGASDRGERDASATARRRLSEREIERPEGQSQFDYLRRMAARLQALDAQLQRDAAGRIRAIGVLGSDIHDKLMLLQALRSRFPDAVFFTTDVDARLVHPREREWARNLVVASSYGLELAPALQGDIPPFRDGYQTSAYLSTLAALDVAVAALTASDRALPSRPQDYAAYFKSWLATPRLYEIGRASMVDLSASPVEPAARTGLSSGRTPGASAADCGREPQSIACTTIHPTPAPLYPEPAATTLRTVVGLLLGALLLIWWLTRRERPLHQRCPPEPDQGMPGDQPPWPHRTALLVLVATIAAMLAVLIAVTAPSWWPWLAQALTRHGDGEPISLASGVSIWPGELLRLLAILLALRFLYRGWTSLTDNLDEVSRKMGMAETRQAIVDQIRSRYRQWPWWGKVLRVFSFRLHETRTAPVNQATGLTPQWEEFWRKYIYQSRFLARCLRVAVLTGLLFAIGRLLILAFGGYEVPYRGDWARAVDLALTWLSVLSMLLLVAFVLDATVLTVQFLHELRKDLPDPPVSSTPGVEAAPGARWPQAVRSRYARKLGVDERYVDNWISMHFIAWRTRVVGQMVYYPFIVIAVMMLARSPLFDRWNLSIGLAVTIGLVLLAVLVCAIVLRWMAETFRRKAIWRLHNCRVELMGRSPASGSPDGAAPAAGTTAEQLAVMIRQIEAFRGGAFAPYLQQPALKALLLPLGGLGGASVIEYLAVLGL